MGLTGIKPKRAASADFLGESRGLAWERIQVLLNDNILDPVFLTNFQRHAAAAAVRVCCGLRRLTDSANQLAPPNRRAPIRLKAEPSAETRAESVCQIGVRVHL